MPSVDIITDPNGVIRRCATQPNPAGYVSKLKSVTSSDPKLLYSDADIRTHLADPNRVPSRVRFDSSWILDQRSKGSCEGHAEANVLGRGRVRRGLQKILFSGAYCYSKVNGGQDNGASLDDGRQALERWGACPADLVTWEMIYPELQPKNADEEAAKHKGIVALAIGDNSTPDLDFFQVLKSVLDAGYDCVVAVHVGNNFQNLDANGVAGVDSGPGNHAVCIDDVKFDEKTGLWLFDMANSWGKQFGTDGRAYLRKEHFVQTRKNHTFWCLFSTNEAGI